ncbi:MAG: PilN domain-containing protein [Comamonas sp.]|uniref:PilN domain-containing protein n=1 Tax=Comamonas denitrificans TaxID=117506 RepID=UPI001B4F8DDB|nr:PilN domain-containing protein [Comamonas sp.]MBP7940356.1 PilN domain-containing protein [Comamonas sp.]HRL95973.1 PilN domain-containing protein [Comamonas denitrificans]
MILINLLPHREIANKRRKEVFQMAMFGALLAGLLAAAVVFSIYQALIGSQQERNSYLKSEISQLDNQIKDIQGLEEEINSLKARQKSVEDLQADRNLPVYLFSDITQLLPEGVYITSMKQTGLNVEVKGSAQSNERVSEVLRNISNGSPWFTKPILKEIVSGTVEVAPKDLRKVVTFTMSFTLVRSTEVKQQNQERKP